MSVQPFGHLLEIMESMAVELAQGSYLNSHGRWQARAAKHLMLRRCLTSMLPLHMHHRR